MSDSVNTGFVTTVQCTDVSENNDNAITSIVNSASVEKGVLQGWRFGDKVPS